MCANKWAADEWNRYCEQKISSGLFTNIINKMCLKNAIYLIHMYKEDLALDNLQLLILFTQPHRSGRIWHNVNF